MKIIFLDFDGVLNGRNWIQRSDYWENPCDPVLVAKLNKIVDATQAKIVISSSWRIGRSLSELRGMLRTGGLTNLRAFIDITPRQWRNPDGTDKQRGDEIQAWLNTNKDIEEITHFTILDDDSDMRHLIPKLVQTNGELGLQDEHVEQAISMLTL